MSISRTVSGCSLVCSSCCCIGTMMCPTVLSKTLNFSNCFQRPQSELAKEHMQTTKEVDHVVKKMKLPLAFVLAHRASCTWLCTLKAMMLIKKSIASGTSGMFL